MVPPHERNRRSNFPTASPRSPHGRSPVERCCTTCLCCCGLFASPLCCRRRRPASRRRPAWGSSLAGSSTSTAAREAAQHAKDSTAPVPSFDSTKRGLPMHPQALARRNHKQSMREAVAQYVSRRLVAHHCLCVCMCPPHELTCFCVAVPTRRLEAQQAKARRFRSLDCGCCSMPCCNSWQRCCTRLLVCRRSCAQTALGRHCCCRCCGVPRDEQRAFAFEPTAAPTGVFGSLCSRHGQRLCWWRIKACAGCTSMQELRRRDARRRRLKWYHGTRTGSEESTGDDDTGTALHRLVSHAKRNLCGALTVLVACYSTHGLC